MRKTRVLLPLAVLALGGCVPSSTGRPVAPSSRVVALAAAATGTAQAPTSTPIRLPTATPGPQETATSAPAITSEAGAAAAGGPRLAPPPGRRPTVEPSPPPTVAPPTQPTTPNPTPAPTPGDAAPPEPLPPGPQDGPQVVPTAPPAAEQSVPLDERNRPLVERASRMLAAELGIGVETITTVLVEAVVWPDGGLGCAQPGAIVQPVETPGYRIVLAAGQAQYEYHTDLDRQVVRC